MSALAEVFEELMSVLDRLEIAFLAAGSVASGVHGLPRQTNDIDLLVDLDSRKVEEFCAALSGRFYVDAGEVRDSLRAGRPFNVIHLKGAYKFDLFPAQDAFAKSELGRRQDATSTGSGLENLKFPVATAEDTLLAKLRFRKGGEQSERQWHDILGIASVQVGRLDLEYLRHWSVELGVDDLLDRVLVNR